MFKWCFVEQACSATTVQLSRHKTVANFDTSMEITKENTIPNGQMVVHATQNVDIIEAGNSDYNIVEPMASGTCAYISQSEKVKSDSVSNFW